MSGAVLGPGLESSLRETVGGQAGQEAVECLIGHVGPLKWHPAQFPMHQGGNLREKSQ